MAAIRETIELVDGFSPVMKNIVGSVNAAVTAMERLQRVMNTPVEGGAFQLARIQADRLNDAVRMAESIYDNMRGVMEKNSSGTKAFGEESGKAADKISSAAAGISRLFNAAGGHKVLGSVKDSFGEASKAARGFEDTLTDIYSAVGGKKLMPDAVKVMTPEVLPASENAAYSSAKFADAAGTDHVMYGKHGDLFKTGSDIGSMAAFPASAALTAGSFSAAGIDTYYSMPKLKSQIQTADDAGTYPAKYFGSAVNNDAEAVETVIAGSCYADKSTLEGFADINKAAADIMGAAGSVGAMISGLAAFARPENNAEEHNVTQEQRRNETDTLTEKYNTLMKAYGKRPEAAGAFSDGLSRFDKQYGRAGVQGPDNTRKAAEGRDAVRNPDIGYRDKMPGIYADQTGAQAAADRLHIISEKAVRASSDLERMSSIAGKLNRKYQTDIIVNYKNGGIEGFEDIDGRARTIADEKKKEAASEALADHNAAAGYSGALYGRRNLQDRINELNSVSFAGTAGYGELSEYQAAYNELNESIKAYEKTVRGTGKTAEPYERQIRPFPDALRTEAKAPAAAADGFGAVSADRRAEPAEAFTGKTIQDYAYNILLAAEAYDKMYEECQESFEKQSGLFDSAGDKYRQTVGMIADDHNNKLADAGQSVIGVYDAVLQSLKDSWASERECFDGLKLDIETISGVTAEQIGISEDKLAVFKQGVEQLPIEYGEAGAAAVEALAEAVRNGDWSAVRSVADEYIAEQEAVRGASEAISTETSGVKNKIGEYVKNIGDKIEELKNVADNANGKAVLIGEGFRSGIESMIQPSVNAARSLVQQVMDIFSSADITLQGINNIPVSSAKTKESAVIPHAEGTLSAERGLSLVGEKGPELIWMNGGERVYNNDETRRILEGLADQTPVCMPRPEREAVSCEFKMPELQAVNTLSETRSSKDINIRINGETLNVNADVNRPDIRGIVMDSIVPAVVRAIENEIFEEGDGSYEY